ncbi:MAG: 50S ribosomal protein L19 [Armatimonadetes bacterium]|nr:50S ribosomal protein L19 [Armatimonadota bacterium]
MPGKDDLLRVVEEKHQRAEIPDFGPGDQVRVHFRVRERTEKGEERVRTQVFEGRVIRRRGSGTSETFTVRRVSHGTGVERTFPLHSPLVERIEVVSQPGVRRARLYYLRERVGKKARVHHRARKTYAEKRAAREAAANASTSEAEE